MMEIAKIRESVAAYVATHPISKGVGTAESACTIAAINLAISGELTDDIPDCVCPALGRAVITLQDAMPAKMRNSERYKSLVPLIAGTRDGREQERADIILTWMWETVLPAIQPAADAGGFGDEWRVMCAERTAEAARAASRAADAKRAVEAFAAAAEAVRAAERPECVWAAERRSGRRMRRGSILRGKHPSRFGGR